MKIKETLTGLLGGVLLFGGLSHLHSEPITISEPNKNSAASEAQARNYNPAKPKNLKISGFPKRPRLSEKQALNYGLMAEDARVFYFDEFTQTKFALETYPNRAKETDPVAGLFLNRGLWDLAYVTSIGTLALGNYISDKIDKTGTLANVVNVAVGIADYLTVMSNYKEFKSALGKSLPSYENNLPLINFEIRL